MPPLYRWANQEVEPGRHSPLLSATDFIYSYLYTIPLPIVNWGCFLLLMASTALIIEMITPHFTGGNILYRVVRLQIMLCVNRRLRKHVENKPKKSSRLPTPMVTSLTDQRPQAFGMWGEGLNEIEKLYKWQKSTKEFVQNFCLHGLVVVLNENHKMQGYWLRPETDLTWDWLPAQHSH